MAKLTPTTKSILHAVPDGDAYWTSDIARDARRTTKVTHSHLKRLEREGAVERVVCGGMSGPSSWRRTPSGPRALSEHKGE